MSIIDVAGSPQPMASADGTLTVTYNGEIYNFAALRAELQGRGAVFTTAGDTEVLLHGWAAWGPALLDRLNGMFAFALHDARRQCLFLARDRLGVKPLHYVELSDGAVAFASELKGLLAHPLLRRSPDIRAVEDYMAFGYVPDDTCLVAGVKKLPAVYRDSRWCTRTPLGPYSARRCLENCDRAAPKEENTEYACWRSWAGAVAKVTMSARSPASPAASTSWAKI